MFLASNSKRFAFNRVYVWHHWWRKRSNANTR